MITCQHARQLFDRHLDDELSPSLQAELHAHVLQCTPCQNQLALFEACGDVIRLDACEPRVSGSFADRVMAGRRQQLAKAPGARSAGSRRILWRIGAPMAAAAAIVLALTLSTLTFNRGVGHKGVVASASVAAPKEVQKNLLALTGNLQDSKSVEELARTPEMKPLPFLEALVEGTRNAAAGTKQSYEDVGTLVRVLLAGTNDRLLAEYRGAHPELSPQDAARVIRDWDILPQIEPVPDQSAAEAAPSKAVASPDPL